MKQKAFARWWQCTQDFAYTRYDDYFNMVLLFCPFRGQPCENKCDHPLWADEKTEVTGRTGSLSTADGAAEAVL